MAPQKQKRPWLTPRPIAAEHGLEPPPKADAALPTAKANHGNSRDPPLALIYVVVLGPALALHGRELFEHFPPASEALVAPRLPDASLVALVATALTVGAPLMAVVRAVAKRNVVAPLAAGFAGLKPGTPKHRKFLEQGWLFTYYSSIVVLNYSAMRGKPWWPPVMDHAASLALSPVLSVRARDQTDPQIMAVYFAGLSFYAMELATLLRLPRNERRSDFVVYAPSTTSTPTCCWPAAG